MKLVVNTEEQKYFENPEGYRSSDDCAAVGPFCRQHGVPYSVTFVCIRLVPERAQSPIRPVGQRHVFNVGDHFGPYVIELKDSVIGDVQVVTVGDFQNVICGAIKEWIEHTEDDALRAYLTERVIDLREKTLGEKKEALENASKRAPHAAYAEARIFRELRASDKKIASS